MSPLEPPTSTVLRDPESNLNKRIMRLLIAVTLGALFLAILTGFVPALLIGVVALAIVGMLNKEALLAHMRWHPPQLEISASPYDLGASPSVTYRRKPKRPTDVSDCTIECRLYCQERVTYTSGSDTTTDSKTVFEDTRLATGEGTADGVIAVVDLHLPVHAGGPSIELPSNQVRWFVEVRVRGPRLPADSHSFAISVAPRLDRSLWGAVQDS